MQGSFPLAPRPYEHVAGLAEVPEDEVLERVQRLVDGRIIRQVTPIFDTRVLGYSSMLVAAKVDPENPWRAGKIINSHPGVSHNYLRNHDFNMWFTIATEPDSELGLQGTLDVLQELTGAESIRQLPTLKLFKIRMDLEMEKGTKDLAAMGVAQEPMEPDPIEVTDMDRAVITALQGDMPVVSEPYAPAAAEVGITRARAARAPGVDEGAQGAAPRGRDPVPPPRRLLGQRHGRLEHPGGADHGGRAADGLLPRHLALLPAARPTRTGPTRCSRWPTGAPRRSATPSWTRSPRRRASRTGARSTRSTEFKKIRLLYYTDEHKRWEAEHAA